MQHHDGQAAEGNAEPKNIGKKIGLKKLLAAKPCAEKAERQRADADD